MSSGELGEGGGEKKGKRKRGKKNYIPIFFFFLEGLKNFFRPENHKSTFVICETVFCQVEQ